jgi:hypothetical protein
MTGEVRSESCAMRADDHPFDVLNSCDDVPSTAGERRCGYIAKTNSPITLTLWADGISVAA